jgi:hypothetical protein
MAVRYATEEEHTERMARAIYLCHFRRITLITGWKSLREDRREAFRHLAREAMNGADRLRAVAWREAQGELAAQTGTATHAATVRLNDPISVRNA